MTQTQFYPSTEDSNWLSGYHPYLVIWLPPGYLVTTLFTPVVNPGPGGKKCFSSGWLEEK